jgi:uncharacterized protein (TIGR00369 family)
VPEPGQAAPLFPLGNEPPKPLVPASMDAIDQLPRLHNENWGFDSNCFVCEPRNAGGLQIPFHHDPRRGVVVAAFRLGGRFSGAPSYVHGGVTLAVLDEAMAWAAIAIGGKFAVTVETTTRFLRPVLVGEAYTVEARLTSQGAEQITATAQVTSGDGTGGGDKVCAEAEATFSVLGEAQAVRATGADASTLDPSLLRANPDDRP